jgi:hypothetical protein
MVRRNLSAGKIGLLLLTLAVEAVTTNSCNPKKHDDSDSISHAESPVPPQQSPAPPASQPTQTGSDPTQDIIDSTDVAKDAALLKEAESTLTNLDTLRDETGAKLWGSKSNCAQTKIAILDNGYLGLKNSLGKRLPPNLSIQPFKFNSLAPSPHGTKLAELIWAMCTGSLTYSPQLAGPTLRLYNANGFSNFKSAIDAIAKDPVDIVLYAQVWEFGGNFDGTGFINAEVNKLTKLGVRWINASGNYGQSTWQGTVQFTASQSAGVSNETVVGLPYQGQYVRMAVHQPSESVKITLAWNDYRDSKDYRTNQDLNIQVFANPTDKPVAEGKLIQDGQDHSREPAATAALYSAHAREQITVSLGSGLYIIRISSPHTQAFNQQSQLRLSASGGDISFLDQTPAASVMIPADNPTVITVGASDVDFSSSSHPAIGVQKPNILAPSILEYANDHSLGGSSTAAAVAAALTAMYESSCGAMLNRQWIAAFALGKFQESKSVSQATPNQEDSSASAHSGLSHTVSDSNQSQTMQVMTLPKDGQCLASPVE